MLGSGLTFDAAIRWDAAMWELLLAVWVVMWFGMKQAKKLENWGERAQHTILVALGFWLLFGNFRGWNLLENRVMPNGQWMRGVGLVLTALGVGIAIWARLSLGSNWSGAVTLKKGHELIRSGLYRWIRHPIYAGILLGMIGTAMTRGRLSGWLGIVVVWAAFYFKARREERFLREEFGMGFEEHSKRTGMFLPKWT